ncbi:MAG TPA: radical SAM protein [Phycisphaerae bacterium]|nr:radical SAM protein [Phycisphaerae bacterium]
MTIAANDIHPGGAEHVKGGPGRDREVIGNIEELRKILPAIDERRAAEMRAVTERYPFRVPRYYVEHVLRNDPADPLWELALPGAEELADAGTERWDTFQLEGKAAEHPRWIQKYRYEVLIRMTNFCSGLCRYCYLKNRENIEGFISHADIDAMFEQAERNPPGRELREVVLSGGDPLTVPGEYLEHLAERVERLGAVVGKRVTVTVHTREPVWYPNRILRNRGLIAALTKLRPSSYILHVVHPREVTRGLHEAMEMLAGLAEKRGSRRQPLMMTQHPLFRGINNDHRIITEMYDALDSGEVVVKPYYLIHPFPDGTLPRHRLRLKESQEILRGLASAPGTRVPLLTVPTPMGKCVIGPWEDLVDRGGYYLLHTKDGVPVQYTTGEGYAGGSERGHIPVGVTVGATAQVSTNGH